MNRTDANSMKLIRRWLFEYVGKNRKSPWAEGYRDGVLDMEKAVIMLVYGLGLTVDDIGRILVGRMDAPGKFDLKTGKMRIKNEHGVNSESAHPTAHHSCAATTAEINEQ